VNAILRWLLLAALALQVGADGYAVGIAVRVPLPICLSGVALGLLLITAGLARIFEVKERIVGYQMRREARQRAARRAEWQRHAPADEADDDDWPAERLISADPVRDDVWKYGFDDLGYSRPDRPAALVGQTTVTTARTWPQVTGPHTGQPPTSPGLRQVSTSDPHGLPPARSADLNA
jgi:hypothetical protein